MLKPVLCAAALAAAIAIPAVAQQAPQGDNPSATPAQPAPQSEGRGPGWRGYPDEGGPPPRWRRSEEGRRYGDEDGPRRWHERRFNGPREGMMGPGGPGMMGPGMMERGAMMGPAGMAHFCGADGGRLGEVMVGRVERATQPTAEQRPGFDKLKEAIGKASETMRGACTTERPVTPPGRLAAAEKRLAAMLEAVRTVRPALDAYYNSLTDEQKARLTLAQPHMGRPGMGERWRERMQRWRDRSDREGRRDSRQSESERL